MTEWSDPATDPEWRQLQRLLEKPTTPDPEVAPERSSGIPLWMLVPLVLAILWLTAVAVYDGQMPAWLGGVIVLGTGAVCWWQERG